MSIMKLAFFNFRNSFKNYLSLMVSLSFTVMVLYNFQNLIYSDAFDVLGTRNKEYVEMIVWMVTFVLVCFLFFFIWYATNVFLTRKKKEIGIYVFMGLSNEKIGSMYLLESTLTGVSALILGLIFGTLSAGLFQMILLALSDLAVEIRFRTPLKPMVLTGVIYLTVYLIFVVKGGISITRSSVLSMMSASRQNEYVRQNPLILAVKSVLGVGILGMGYGLALKKGGAETMANALAAVVLVTVGVYLLFGGLIPAVFQTLAKNKRFLYRNQRVLWVNSMIFRMKKNYRTYAMVCILMLCSVTALATSFAMKGRYQTIIQFENTYTFQVLGSREDLGEEARRVIGQDNEITFSSQIPILSLDAALVNSRLYSNYYGIIPFSELRQLTERTGMKLDFEEPEDDQVVKITHPVLMSLLTDQENIKVEIGEKSYEQIGETTRPYLGYLQEAVTFYAVSDKEYDRLRPMGKELFTYNYRIREADGFKATRDRLDQWIGTLGDDTARVAIDPESNELDWVKVMYSICIFMFLVFVMAGGSIMFMKLYNDGFEEKERYSVLMKMGLDQKTLKKSIQTEMIVAYGLPFLVMTVSSFFSVGALASMMYTNLTMVNAVSVTVVLVILLFWYHLSVQAYAANTGLTKNADIIR